YWDPTAVGAPRRAAPSPQPESRTPEPALAPDAEALPPAALRLLRERFAEVLRQSPAQLLPDQTFERFGVDSLLVLALTRRLEADFGTLPKTLLFEHNTLRKLADHLADR